MVTIARIMLLAVVLCASPMSVRPAQARMPCTAYHLRTFENQTVTREMTVTGGRRCSVSLTNAGGPMDGVKLLERPKHGSVVLTGAHIVTYQAPKGYVGSDSFSYARVGRDRYNTPFTMTVAISVNVVQ